jgi:hypothetical protein
VLATVSSGAVVWVIGWATSWTARELALLAILRATKLLIESAPVTERLVVTTDALAREHTSSEGTHQCNSRNQRNACDANPALGDEGLETALRLIFVDVVS